MKKLSIIVAAANNMGIGKDNDLLFHISEDLQRFKKFTTGNTIIMGRKTFESLPNGPLPKRRHIILTRNSSYNAPGCIVVASVKEAIELCDENESFVIGGADIYELFLPFCTTIYFTKIEKSVDADVFFPDFSKELWKVDYKSKMKRDEKSGVNYYYINYIRS